jgi:hypothetical protein
MRKSRHCQVFFIYSILSLLTSFTKRNGWEDPCDSMRFENEKVRNGMNKEPLFLPSWVIWPDWISVDLFADLNWNCLISLFVSMVNLKSQIPSSLLSANESVMYFYVGAYFIWFFKMKMRRGRAMFYRHELVGKLLSWRSRPLHSLSLCLSLSLCVSQQTHTLNCTLASPACSD